MGAQVSERSQDKKKMEPWKFWLMMNKPHIWQKTSRSSVQKDQKVNKIFMGE